MANEDYLAVLKASYDYDAQGDDEIGIKEDQILFLLERTDDDWWKVKLKGDSQEDDTPSGLVPAAYVELAEPSGTVKALYDYAASAPGELSIQEDEVLHVFDTEDEWLLVQSDKPDAHAGYVPANYVEDADFAAAAEPEPAAAPALVIPDSPPRPSAPYVDPADRVASSKADGPKDDVKTWSVSEVDKAGKKKKGTLGVGNGSVFFASESDKTPVQKWPTADIDISHIEKKKHVHISIEGANPIELHFSASSKDNAEEIIDKLDSSKKIARAQRPSDPTPEPEPEPEPEHSRITKAKASVHFSPASPVIIPPRSPSPSVDGEDPPDAEDGETAVALYDFTADGDDELSVAEGEQLVVIEKDGDEWWKCRNEAGNEGVVPASYLEATTGSAATTPQPDEVDEDEETDDGAAERDAAAAAAAAEAAAAQRAAEERLQAQKEKEKQKAEKDRERKERKEHEEKAKAEQEARERAKAARQQREERQKQRAAAASPPSTSRSPPAEEKSSKTNGRASKEKDGASPISGPPPDRVRIWHDRSGQFRVEAAFLGYASGKLRLHKVNGVIVEVPAEKMSVEDMKFVEKMAQRSKSSKHPQSDDDVPLANVRRESLAKHAKKRGPQIDWFEFFLNAGCDIDDCTRYSASFERERVDAALLPDITEATLRSLGLREGDVIRVTKVIKEKYAPKRSEADQIKADEEYARALQAKETPPAPNMFTGPGGQLKNARRGRPQPSKSLPPATVDLIGLSNASDQIQRTSSPLTPTKASPVQGPGRSSSAAPAASGFGDDAWTNRPSSTKPAVPTPPPAAAARPPSAPPASASAPSDPSKATSPSLANTTESDIFNQLARLSELRTNKPQGAPSPAPGQPTPPVASTPTPAGASPAPMISSPPPQPVQMYNGPRGPFAPVPANQSLLQPLVPTQTGFNSFVPTRPTGFNAEQSASPFAGGVPAQQFLSTQPTGFPGMMSQPTGFQPSLQAQPTGMPMGAFGGGGFQNGGFGAVQSNPTGFNPGFGQFGQSPPPVPPLPASIPSPPPQNNHNPANIFAQMKSGTFGEDNAPQSADKYNALRPSPNPMFAQQTGFYGANGYGGFQ